MLPAEIVLADSIETGKLKIFHLKRFWSRELIKRYKPVMVNDLASGVDAGHNLAGCVEAGY
jgi:hypothetical protein